LHRQPDRAPPLQPPLLGRHGPDAPLRTAEARRPTWSPVSRPPAPATRLHAADRRPPVPPAPRQTVEARTPHRAVRLTHAVRRARPQPHLTSPTWHASTSTP